MNLADYLTTVKGKVVLGVDGFIDEVWQVLETRTDVSSYQVVEHMKQFGELITEHGSGGLARELIRKRRSCGGFTANTGRAVGTLGIDTTLVGCFGKDKIDSAFDEFKSYKCISAGDPAISNILEFSDGKIMLPNLENLLNLDWLQFKRILDNNAGIFDGVDVIGLGYWSNMPDFDNMLVKLVDSFSTTKPSRMFFDFANVTKKSVSDLKQTLSVMSKLNKKIPMTLSLNEHEGLLLFEHYGIPGAIDTDEITAKLSDLRDKVGIDEIIIHTPHLAAIATPKEQVCVMQNFVENPIRTAGAGDSFNGGYIVSCLGNLKAAERLTIANAVTKFYLENGKPPEREQLIAVL